MEWIPIISILTITSGLGIIFDKLLNDRDIKVVKNKIFDVWYGLSDEEFDFAKSANNLHKFFNDLFDRIYGKKHLSLKCFFRSALSSILSASFFYFIVMVFFPIQSSGKLGLGPFQFLSSASWTTFLKADYMVFSYIFINIIIDYISLIETRFFLKKIVNKHFGVKIFYLLVDLFLSFLLFVIIYLTYYQFYNPALWSYTGGYINQFLLSIGLSTFVTSLIFYLFNIFYLLLKILSTVRIPIRLTLERIASLKNPVTSLVGVLGGIILIIKGIKDLI